jgi:hypothetical protein
MARLPGEPEVAVVAATVDADTPPSIDWRAVVGGAILTSAISFVLLTFGTGIGLSITSPYPREGVSVTAFLIILALWVVWVSLTSFFAGGYLAGRMRRKISLSTHETEVRDGVHGVLVWALGLLLSAFIALWTAGGVAKTGTEAVTASVTAATTGFAAALSKATDPVGYLTDTLFRLGGPASAGSQPAAAASHGDPRGEAVRIFARNAINGEVSAEDQAYLTQLVSRETGLSEADAKTRVDAVLAQFRSAVEAARAAAEKARKFGLMLSFLTAATLAISAAAAWWAAVRGGEHRDQGKDFSAIVRWA